MPGVSVNVNHSPGAAAGSRQGLREDRTILGDIRGGAVILGLCSIFSDAGMTHVNRDGLVPFKSI